MEVRSVRSWALLLVGLSKILCINAQGYDYYPPQQFPPQPFPPQPFLPQHYPTHQLPKPQLTEPSNEYSEPLPSHPQHSGSSGERRSPGGVPPYSNGKNRETSSRCYTDDRRPQVRSG